jgi:hypothetical protein
MNRFHASLIGAVRQDSAVPAEVPPGGRALRNDVGCRMKCVRFPTSLCADVPKADVPPLGSPSFPISRLKEKDLAEELVVARCTTMWLGMHGVPRIFPIPIKRRKRVKRPGPTDAQSRLTCFRLKLFEPRAVCERPISVDVNECPSRFCDEPYFAAGSRKVESTSSLIIVQKGRRHLRGKPDGFTAIPETRVRIRLADVA